MDEMEIIGIGDDTARLSALYSGDVQMITSISPASIPDVESRKDVRLNDVKAPRFTPLNMMVDRPPFQNNPDLRLALKYLFDREKVLKTIYKGRGQIGNDHLFAPDDPFYNTALPVRKLDHDKAKFHLKKAKMENATLELHVGEAAFGSVELGMMLQAEAAKVGLTIDLKRDPSDGYWTNVWRNKSFHAGEWDARPTDDLLLTQGYKSDSKWNETGYKNEKLDKLIDEGRATLDSGKRKEIYHEIQKIFYEDGTSIVPAFADLVAAVNAKVRGLIPVRIANLSGQNFADSVWMET